MKLNFNINNKNYYFDSNKPINIAITQNFDDNQPTFFNADKAVSSKYMTENFTGDTNQNGSCNVNNILMITVNKSSP